MNLLYSNDRRGTYPNSWYAATANASMDHPQLRGDVQADVCVIGAGFTGLSAALHLAERGVNVVLLDAHKVGFGASGRNGGQLGSGQRQDQKALINMVGRAEAAKLWHLGEDAKALVRHLIKKHDIDCDYRPGVAWTGFSKKETQELHAYADLLSREYGYEVEKLDQADCHALCPSPAYKGGIVDMGAGHLHPLNFALGLSTAAQKAGVRVFERTHVHHIDEGTPNVVRTDQGRIKADTVVLATNGYHGGLNRKVSARVMPINNYVAATEPLDARGIKVLTRDVAVADTKFVVNYFRLSRDGRLLFGGGESYGYRFPSDIAAKVRKPMLEIFPQLSDVKIDYAWGGTLAITMTRLPYFGQVGGRILSASGYSGHGLGTATHAGQLMAEAILGDSAGFDVMARLPMRRFPGGPAMRTPLLTLAMTWYALRDRLSL